MIVNNILQLKQGVVYGPVNSRRLGKSLGINVLAAGIKVCTFNCLYCQYGYTRIKAADLNRAQNFFSMESIIDGLETRLKNEQLKPDYLTFSGNGEATLHPDFADLVTAVNRLRDNYTPTSRTAILSNGTQIVLPRVRTALEKLDLRIIKLDCAGKNLLQSYNRPVIPVDLPRLILLLTEMPEITIQALFTSGPSGNSASADLREWISIIKSIRPHMVQMYSLDRGYPSRKIEKISAEYMQPVIEELVQTGISARWY